MPMDAVDALLATRLLLLNMVSQGVCTIEEIERRVSQIVDASQGQMPFVLPHGMSIADYLEVMREGQLLYRCDDGPTATWTCTTEGETVLHASRRPQRQAHEA